MATQYSGVNQSKTENGQMIGDGVFDYTRIKYRDDSKVLNNNVVGDTIKVFGVLPPKARIKNIKIFYPAMGSSVTFAVGDSVDSARYITASSVSAAGMIELKVADGFDYVVGTVTGDNQVLITIAGASTTASNLTIKGVLSYV